MHFARHHQQGVVDRQPQAIVAPQVEPVAHSRHRREAGRRIRQGSPPRSRYRIASTIRLLGHFRGRPTCEAGGSSCSRTAHSASVKSLGKASPLRACKVRVASVHIVDPSKFLANPLESTTGQAVKQTC
jgi:hypothetical protein